MKIGILGGGQLARMLCLAGLPLGLEFRVLDPSPQSCAAAVAEHIVADYEDTDALERFVAGVDVVTYEFENVPQMSAAWLEKRVSVFPPPVALEKSQDRLVEKTFLQGLDIPTAPFVAVSSQEELDAALAKIGLPAVLKTRRMGYDGKGQFVLRTQEDADNAWRELSGQELILEGFVRFDRELSILAVRGRAGETAFYPLVENHHREGILRLSLCPAPNSTSALQAQGETYARNVLETLNYVGVLAIEFFEFGGTLVANEMAPRVHNSGHWTIEGAEYSQFENHVRAVAGLPLGSTSLNGVSAMLNIIGDLPDTRKILETEHAHLHLYGKSPRAGRKIGHVTIREQNLEDRNNKVAALRELGL